VPFRSGDFSVSRVDPSAELSVPAVDVLPLLEGADLAKVDIEGAEWAILGDSRFTHSSPGALVLEYHPHLCPEPGPADVAEQLLRAAGYRIEWGQTFGEGHGIVWAWRT
jgi:hypothetical protein